MLPSVIASTISTLPTREKIMSIEDRINAFNAEHGTPEPVCPLKHHFAPGAYCREIFIPANSLIVGKIHKHAHLNMLMQGHVSVATEDGVHEYVAPGVFVSKAGTKRVVFTHEDTIWATVHLTDKTDLAEIEDEIIAKTYGEYDAVAEQRFKEAICRG